MTGPAPSGGGRPSPAASPPSPGRWRALEPLLDAALALPAERRAAFLDAACSADPALRDELARMVAECERDAGSLDRPAGERFAALLDRDADDGPLRAALADRYTVERQIGRGGMGTVYLARDLRHAREVALKVLSPDIGAGSGARRFLSEIRVTAGLRHPHLLPLYDSGEAAGRLYYVAPYVAGGTLRDRLTRDGRPPVADARRVLRDVAAALAHAHAHGVVHRDVKPENVLLDEGGAVLADFGVAAAVARVTGAAPDGAPATALTRGAIGTPAYMAPEQAAGDPATDHRADLYALGVVAYEVLAGAHPFAGRAPHAMLAAQLTEAPPPLAERRPDVPPALAAVTMRLLEKRPEDRPASAEEVVRALDAAEAAEATGPATAEAAAGAATGAGARAAGPTTAGARAGVRRWAAPAGALAVALGAAAGGVAWYRARGHAAPPPAAPADARAAARRVLVVPPENATGDGTLAPLGRMTADWIAQGLATTGIVDVVPASADVAGEARVRAAARENGAGTVVYGAYYLDGDSVRLQARVIDAARWRLLRAVAPVSAPRRSPNALLEPARQRVMSTLAVAYDPRFAGWESGSPPPTYAAYEQNLAGLDLFEKGDWAAAIPYFTRSAAIDTTYAQPLLAVVDAYSNLGRPAQADSVVRLLERRREALGPADRAHLDRSRAGLDGNWTAALAGARAAEAAAPGAMVLRYLHASMALRARRPSEALEAAAPIAVPFGGRRTAWTGAVYWNAVTAAHHMLGNYAAELAAARTGRAYHPDSRSIRAMELRALAALGRLDALRQGVAELETMPSAPGDVSAPSALVAVAQELDAHGRPDDARAVLRRAAAAAQARPPAEQATPAARAELARIGYLLGDYDAAAPLFARLTAERPDDPSYLAYEGLIAAHRGRRADAARAAERLRTLRIPFDRGRATYGRARIAAALGDRASALTLLRQALSEGVSYGPALHADPDLAPLRSDPGFQALLRPQG